MTHTLTFYDVRNKASGADVIVETEIHTKNVKHSLKNTIVMDDKMRRRRRQVNRSNFWIAVGAVILIILLILWLTMADLAGDTDVAAMILPRF